MNRALTAVASGMLRPLAPCALPFLLASLLVAGCGDDDAPADASSDTNSGDTTDGAIDSADGPDADLEPPPVIGAVDETRRISMPGLSAPGYIVFTENDVPHVYAENREDAARLLGYIVARDRFFEMDMARRLSTGRLSALLGDAALEIDMESRGTGMTVVVDTALARFTGTQRARYQAFVEGVNAYIEAVGDREELPPEEYSLAAPLFGVRVPALLEPFTLRDVSAVAAAVTYSLGYETTDVGHARAQRQLADHFDGAPLQALRHAGLLDAFDRVTNSEGYASAGGWGSESGDALPIIDPVPPRSPLERRRAVLPEVTLARLADRLAGIQERLHRVDGFGSNAWAVAGSRSSDGAAMLCGDGHLPGTVPTLFFRMGVDTKLLGGGDTRQVGLAFPGVPLMAVGTNGDVAWNQTQFFGDITDWFEDELLLDDNGAPRATRYLGEERPVTLVEEVYEIADRPSLSSVGRTVRVNRVATFDGRLITAIEGRVVTEDEAVADGEFKVMLLSDFVVPQDLDGDGVIRAVSFDYTPLDGPNFGLTLEEWGHARTVREMQERSDALVGYSQNVVAADSSGDVAYLPYQVMPCREHLRGDDGRFADGADPRLLIDGTRFRGFELPLSDDGRVDESVTAPHRCVVPRDRYPAAVAPGRGFVVTANNDPGTMAQDNDLENDPFYIGGPWHEDFRATRIDDRLRASEDHDVSDMAELQADVRSPLGAMMTGLILEGIADARAASETDPAGGSVEARLAELWRNANADYDEVERRLIEWRDRGFLARSGVATFYEEPTEADRRDAVATMIFNAWLGRFERKVLGDERFPGGTLTPTGSGGRMRLLTRWIRGRGEGNPLELASFNPDTNESAFFDVLGTDEIETATEDALLALDEALAFLRSSPTGPGAGGFGTGDGIGEWDQWLWGLRHHTRFDALIGDFLDGDDMFGFLVDRFSITPERLPLAPDLNEDDPRFGLPGFPRGGDNFVVDAANNGFSPTDFTFGSIPVFRMVVAVRGDETTGQNTLPGGQSGRPASPHFADQAQDWLANQTTPMRLTPEQVIAGANARFTFVPQP